MTKKITQTLIPDLLQITPKFYSQILLARENIESQLFTIAKEHAEMASRDIDRSNAEERRKEMKHSIIAIVMSYTAVEALSNNLFQILTGHSFASNEFKKFDGELNSKWEYLSQIAYQQMNNTNEKKALPREVKKQLIELKEIRDQIIHYKPKPENLDKLGRFPDNSPINPEFTLFTSEEATKAIETVRNVLKTFEKVTGYEVPKIE